jgi:hypothetical protein
LKLPLKNLIEGEIGAYIEDLAPKENSDDGAVVDI